MMIVQEVDPLSSCSSSSTLQIESASCLNCSQRIDESHANSYKTHLSLPSSDDDDEDSLAISLVQLLESLYKLKYLKSCPFYSTSIVEDLNLCVCAKCAGPLFKCYELFRQFDLLRAADSFLTKELEKLEDCITKHHNHFQQQQQQREETENIKQEINLDNYNDETPASPIDFNENPFLNIENNVNSDNKNNVDSSSLNLSAGPWILLKRLEDDKVPVNFTTTTTKRTSTRRRSKNVERVDDFCKDEDDEDYEPSLKRTRVSKSKQPVKSRSTRKITNSNDDIKFVDAVKIEEETTSTKSTTSQNVKIQSQKKGSKLKKSDNKNGYKKEKNPKEKEKKANKNDNSEASISTTTKPSKGRGGRRVASDYVLQPKYVNRKMNRSYKRKKMKYPNPCWYCDEHFSTQSECLTHTRETHSEAEDDLICDQCSKIFKDSNEKALVRHKKKDCILFMPGQILPGIPCPHAPCSKKFPDDDALKLHTYTCHGNAHTCPYENEGCSFKSKNPGSLKSHLRFQHELGEAEKNTFKCEECNKFLKNEGTLYSHNLYFHTEKGCQTYKERARMILDRQKVERAVVREERLKSYICTECNVNCFTSFALVYHKKKYHSHLVSNYVCDQCGNGFTHRASFRHHKAYAHTDKRAFVCDQCGKDFKSTANLKEHLRRVHTEEGKKQYNAYMRLHQKRRKYTEKQIQAVTSNEWADLNIPPELTAAINNNNTHSISNASASTQEQQQSSFEFGFAKNL